MKSALIGKGYWGNIIEKYINDSNEFELVTIYDSKNDEESKLIDIISDVSIECIFICTPVNTHYELTKTFLEAGKHVFCEKPLVKQSQEIIELQKIASMKKVCLYTDYIYTVSPSINYIKKHIEEIGQIVYIRADINQYGKFYPDDNVYEVIGVHLISAIMYILQHKENVNMIVKDVKDLVTDFSGNTLVGVVEFEISNTIKGIINCSLLANKKERKIEVIGNKGRIEFDMLAEDNVIEMIYGKYENGHAPIVERRNKFIENESLVLALKDFFMNISNMKQENLYLSYNVTRVIEQINGFSK